VTRAEALSRKNGQQQRSGAQAYRATGGFSDAKVIRKFGDVPGDELSAL
jgi:hypothetical protein